MKKILLGLLALTSLSGFANCDLDLDTDVYGIDRDLYNEEYLDSLAQKLDEKGYTIVNSKDSRYKIYIQNLGLQFQEEVPFTALGVYASFYDREDSENNILIDKLDRLVKLSREELRHRKIAYKTTKKLIRMMPVCDRTE
jgi:hypothetical protein